MKKTVSNITYAQNVVATSNLSPNGLDTNIYKILIMFICNAQNVKQIGKMILKKLRKLINALIEKYKASHEIISELDPWDD